jgi:hypothetical protein
MVHCLQRMVHCVQGMQGGTTSLHVKIRHFKGININVDSDAVIAAFTTAAAPAPALVN